MATNSSLGIRQFWPGPVQNSPTGTSRRPEGPAMIAIAPAAASDGMVSPDGAELHRLPPRLARPWMAMPPTILAESMIPAYPATTAGCEYTLFAGTAAPIVTLPSALTWISDSSSMPLMSTTRSTWRRPTFICTRRSVPPANARARPGFSARSATASFTVPGRTYSKDSMRAASPSDTTVSINGGPGGAPPGGSAGRAPTSAGQSLTFRA